MSRLRIRPRPPLALALPALLAVAFLLLPLIGILSRTQWGELGTHLTSPGVVEALRLSLVVSLWALGLSLLLGVPLAWLLARVPFKGKALVRSLVLLPMVLPPTVGGVALLLGFGRRGLLGPWLEGTFGITLPFHTSGAVVAATFVAMPFLVISLEGALGGLKQSYEETAASLGAPPVRVFFTVTLPMVAPGLVAGAALTWARALGEFGATITFAGNLPGTTQTLPLQVYLLLQDKPEAATSVSLLLLAIAMGVLIALRGRWTGTPVAAKEAGAAAVTEEPSPSVPGPDGGDGGPVPDGEAVRADGGDWALHAEVTGFNELTLDAGPGTTIAVVGENGAGKTTLLRALLGLTPRAHARLRLGDTDVTALPPHRRQVAWVPQDGALFPHLTALANTAYGLRARGAGRAEARREAQDWLDRLGVGHLARRKPAQLSGGQAQRVALARALAARPRLLLLDEPLAALDQTTRAHVRHTLRTHLAGFGGVCLIVTHDPVEAVSLADRVLVLSDGRTLQDAAPAEVTRRPRSPWVARMLGRNAWPGTASADGMALGPGGRLVVAESLPEGAAALAIIAPEAVAVHRERPGGSPRNVWPGTVREITAVGSRLRVLVGSAEVPDLVAEITPEAAAELGLADGAAVWTSVKATEVTLVRL
ncbi:Fe(3+) ions import ATP-binding protein FbpC [Streptomyces lavendulae subsp. lavendulae]|uniref:Fe(3+) ions import ATP-binding protein FbpC n=1 Tax=Streptomyces lavendulae subsp. lavendulae TaxID=58340 RepID=A0A2K8PR54_STRLA|nr:ABC transporter permease [Streptomyces lavendulae]ATZ28293.1 Fe(3+) ions import ATP-binding protein FbpC [Streptomyces lavendulae subsp. lavendulae]QUQ58121.1 Vitamin B12 import ATP-binding protein BtuD [Streptomyces lavendulae subsp. lavendulae]